MEELIRKAVAGDLSKPEQRELVDHHHRHFLRAVRALPDLFFPGKDKSEAGLRSFGNGAYAFFQNERCFGDRTAFEAVVDEPDHCLWFLYYRRGNSATMTYIDREGSEQGRRRRNELRAVRNHLREGFQRLKGVGRDDWWWIEGESVPPRPADFELRPLASLQIDPPRGKAALEAILRSHGAPLSRAELAYVFSELKGTWGPAEVAWEPDRGGTAAGEERQVLDLEVAREVRKFYERLSADERLVLRLRGWGEERPTRSFREVATEIGRRTHEHWRLKERGIMQVFAERFADEPEVACRVLARLIRESAE